MSDWGKVGYNPKRRHWYVKGTWQGQRHYFSQYQSQIGPITCETEQMAIRLKQAIDSDIDKGIFNPARYKQTRPLHLREYSENWLKTIKSDLSTGAWSSYEKALRLYINPTIGDRFLPDIGHPDLRKVMDAMAQLAPKSKKNVMGALHKLMKDACRDGHITQMPAWIEFRGKNRVVDPIVRYLTVENQLKIIDKIPLRHRPIFMFMMSCGCRPSEARALRKRDVKERDIYFRVTFGYRGELKEVKSAKERVFPIHAEMRDILDNTPKSISEWFFVNPDTGRHYSKEINRLWNAACDAAGIQRFRLYNSVRHSYACQLLNSGVDKHRVARLLGHSDLRSIDRYAVYETAALENDAGKVKRFMDFKKDKVDNNG